MKPKAKEIGEIVSQIGEMLKEISVNSEIIDKVSITLVTLLNNKLMDEIYLVGYGKKDKKIKKVWGIKIKEDKPYDVDTQLQLENVFSDIRKDDTLYYGILIKPNENFYKLSQEQRISLFQSNLERWSLIKKPEGFDIHKPGQKRNIRICNFKLTFLQKTS